jgi:predicted GNAT family acetyltransferase
MENMRIFRNNRDRSRYEMEVEDQLCTGEYRLDGDIISLYHVKVPFQFSGKGIGSEFLKLIFDDIINEKLKLSQEVICPFVSHYITKHEEWEKLYC